ncbi:uncharacterized protein A4U43_C08F33030 [Asparagus officinalis]|uniref:reticulon-like protein B1 n=1 Tax=Asparagus officinalis TaxID=4686 RepID=UPI00098E3CEF|nr:reticulon-like protein B1 [Asparagus officinalis]ONK61735.1 uncharacterized protein A4U43_C08F33030 [Asparagus officinalis]
MSEYGSPTFKNNEDKGSSSSSDSEQETKPTISKKKMFGRTVPIHGYIGGGKAADVVLWRNKQMTGGIVVGVTTLWLLFEGMDYHLLTFICHCLILSLLLLFFGSYAAPLVNRKPPTLPEVILSERMFLSVALALRLKINEAYSAFRRIASGRDIKQFLKAIGCLWVVSVVSKWFSFLTLIYIVFLLLISLPRLYETYEDEVDNVAHKAMVEINKKYTVLDDKVLRKIPCCPFSDKSKKHR